MTTLFQVLLFSLFFTGNQFDSPQILKNGKYVVNFDPEFKYHDYIIVINNNSYIKYSYKDTLQGTIQMFGDKYLIFKDVLTRDQSDTNRISKMLHDSFGDNCIEILKTTNNKLYFRTTYIGNLHITINKGKFQKIKN
jgi:hypothetical protein